jgi:hypothetical protein
LLGTNIAAGKKVTMENLAKTNTSMNLGLPIDKEKGRDFTRVHGIDRAMGYDPNTFPVEMASSNGGIEGMGGGGAPRQFWRRRRLGERERQGVEWGLWGRRPPTCAFQSILKPP